MSRKKINKKKEIEKEQYLYKIKNKQDLTATKSGEGADVSLYSVSYNGGGKNAYLDVTEKGGHPLTLLVDRPINDRKISLHEGLKKAEEYVKEFEFEDMVIFQSNEYDNIGVYSFLHNEDGTRVYSDAIEVKVALDNGDILGFTARNYFMNHKDRDLPKPKITDKERSEEHTSELQIKEEHLAVIDNDLGDEVLTYEYLGVLGDQTYRIFINAMDGREEK